MAVIDIAIQPGDEERIQRAVSHALANLNLEERSQPN